MDPVSLSATNDQLTKIISILEQQGEVARQDRRAILDELGTISKYISDFWMADGVRQISKERMGASEKPESQDDFNKGPALEQVADKGLGQAMQQPQVKKNEEAALDMACIQSKLATMACSLLEATSKVHSLEDKLRTSDNVIENLERDLRASQSKVQELDYIRAKANVQDSKFEQLEQRLRALEFECSRTRENEQESDSKVEQINARIERSEVKAGHMQAELRNAEAQIELLEAKLATTDVDVSNVKLKVDAHAEMISQVRCELSINQFLADTANMNQQFVDPGYPNQTYAESGTINQATVYQEGDPNQLVSDPVNPNQALTGVGTMDQPSTDSGNFNQPIDNPGNMNQPLENPEKLDQPVADQENLNQLHANAGSSSELNHVRQSKIYEIEGQRFKVGGNIHSQIPSAEDIQRKANYDLWMASKNGDVQGIESALGRGAQLDHRIDNYSPLDIATFHGHSFAIEALLIAGADVHSEQSKGWTTLHFAARKGHNGIMALLLERGADKEAVDVHGRTPLIVAAYYGHASTVRFLLENGAKSNTKDTSGRTAHDCAGQAGKGKEAVLKVLEELKPSKVLFTTNL